MATVRTQPTRRQTEQSHTSAANGSRRPSSLGEDWSKGSALSTSLLTGHDIVDMLHDSDFEVFSDVGGETWFHWKSLPEGLRAEEPPKSRPGRFAFLVPIASGKMRALLNAWIYVDELGQLKPGAMNEALSILEGIALTRPKACELETAVETNPVLEAVLVLLEVEGRIDGTATDLLAILNQISGERDWKLERHPNWPRNGSQLSHMLDTLADLFTEAGYTYWYRRSNGQRLHCFFPIRAAKQKAAPPEKNDEPQRENPAPAAAAPQQASGKPNVSSQAASTSPNASVASRPPQSLPSGSAASAGVSKSAQSPARLSSVAKFIEQMRSAESAGSAGDFQSADLVAPPFSKPTDWKRAVKKK